MRISIHIVLIGSKLRVPDDDGALLVPGDEDVAAADDLEDAAGVAGEGLEQGEGGQLVDVQGEASLGVISWAQASVVISAQSSIVSAAME